MKIKCVAPWAGQKRTLAPRIVGLLGEHDEYHEPFVGGCSILASKPRCKTERINDLNPKIVNVLTCIRDCIGDITSQLERVEFSPNEFDSAKWYLECTGSGKRPATVAAAQLIAWWMGPSGLAGTTTKGWFATRHTTTGGHPAVRWENFKSSLLAHSERLQSVEISQLDFGNFMAYTPDRKGVTIYVDPPYFSKSFRYECDFNDLESHRRLSVWMNDFEEARIVISYYDDVSTGSLCDGSLLDELYPPAKWRRIEVEMSKASASASGKAKRAIEVLLVNDAAAEPAKTKTKITTTPTTIIGESK